MSVKMAHITYITEDRWAEWDALAKREPAFAVMQSWAWGSFKEDFGWEVFRVAVEEDGRLIAGAQMLIKSLLPGIVSMAYVPRGPLGDWMEEPVLSLLLNELHRLARDHRALFLRFEPPLPDSSPCASLLRKYNFKSSAYTNQERATIIVDLAQDMDTLLAGFHHKTRYNIRYAAKHGVTVRVGTEADLPLFHNMMKLTGQRGGFTVRSLDYYRGEWRTLSNRGQIRLLIAQSNGQPIAVNTSVAFGKCAAYLHGASSGAHSNLQPNYLLMWEAMQWAYSQNCSSFDLWGIPEEIGVSVCQHGEELPVQERTDDLWGVYRFKRGFSSTIQLFTSAHDYVYLPLIYALAMNKFFNTYTFEQIASFIGRHKRFSRLNRKYYEFKKEY
jgi:peptidoglycan pentaglycine glycine transferase (the first glycine)